MPFTSCVSFVSDAGKRHSCPSWLMAALGIGFGNVLLTDPFDVLFARIYSDAPKRVRYWSRLCLQMDSNRSSIARKWKIMLFSLYFTLLYVALFWENMIDRVWIMCQWIMNSMCQQCWCGCLSWKDVTDDWSSFINIVFNNMWITRSYEHFTVFYSLPIISDRTSLCKFIYVFWTYATILQINTENF